MRLSLLVSVLAFLLSLSVAGVSFAGSLLGDGDGDTIDSLFDNCRDTSNTDQRDPDGDGCGAVCDGDYDQDGVVGASDFAIFRAAFQAGSFGNPGFNPNVDAGGNGVVADRNFKGPFR